MPLVLTGANGIFTQIGKPIKHINTDRTLNATTKPAEEDAIADIFEAGDADARREFAALARSIYAGEHNTITGWANSLAGIVTRRLQDRTTVLEQLTLSVNDIGSVLDRLITQLVLDAASVDASVVTIGAVTAASGNVGNGTVLTSKVLDAYSSPGLGMAPHVRYNTLDSELAVASDTHTIVCVSDSKTSGGVEAREQWRWYGNTKYPVLDYRTEGAGEGSGIQTLDASEIIANRNFEGWSANVPTNWTLISGTVAGTHIAQESTEANVFRGTSGIKLIGVAATPDPIGIQQTVSARLLQPKRRYCLSVRVMADAAILVGSLNVLFEGSGYTAAASEKVLIAAASLPTSWTLYNFFWNTPATIASDLKLTIKITGALTDTKRVWVDSLSFGPASWHGGINAVVVPGRSTTANQTAFNIGDRFTFSVTNDAAGTFQEFFRRYYGVQLPSNNAALETILDSLAE